MAEVIDYRFRPRRALAATWTTLNDVLLDQELGIEKDTGRMKMGPGAWNTLPYWEGRYVKAGSEPTEGQALSYNATTGFLEWRDTGKTYLPGTGIDIANPTSSTPTINSTLGSIAVTNDVANYASLPTLSAGDAGQYWITRDTGMAYRWDGSLWPAEGSGVSIEGNGSASLMAARIMQYTPRGFWRCDDSSGSTIADSSGNGFDLTLIGTRRLACSALIPGDPTLFLRLGPGIGYAKRTGNPLYPVTNASWTIVVIARFMSASSAGSCFLFIGANGETESTNVLCGVAVRAAATPYMFWEYGPGNNVLLESPFALQGTSFFAVRFDATTMHVTTFVNGDRVDDLVATQYATGGTLADTFIGTNEAVSVQYNGDIGMLAFFGAALSDDAIKSISAAGGF